MSRSLRVPSFDRCTSSTRSEPIVAAAASLSRVARDRLLIWSQDVTPCWCNQRYTCSPRKRDSPSPTTSSVSSSSVMSRASRMFRTRTYTTGGASALARREATAVLLGALGRRELGAAEEEGDLLLRGLGRVRAVHGVAL